MKVNKSEIGNAIDRALSGIVGDRNMFEYVQDGASRRRKRHTIRPIAMVAAVVIVLALSAFAIAANMGVFGRLGGGTDADPRLDGLESVTVERAEPYARIDRDALSIIVEQAYFDGDRVFLSFEITSGELIPVYGDGKPDGIEWSNHDPDSFSKGWVDEQTDADEAFKWLSEDLNRYVAQSVLFVDEGMSDIDGRYMPIIGGGLRRIDERTYIGWKECSVEGGNNADAVKAVLNIYLWRNYVYRGEDELCTASREIEHIEMPVTILRSDSTKAVCGEFNGSAYHAVFEGKRTPFDVCGRIYVDCPSDWIGEYYSVNEDADVIIGWTLYYGDTELQCEDILGGYEADSMNSIFYDVNFVVNDEIESMRLVPIYSLSGAHEDEFIDVMPAN